jgi:hypothetical protein
MPFITDEEARGMAGQMQQRAAVDPVFAEDLASIGESMSYVVQLYEGTGRAVRCECCGTLVTRWLEAEASRPLSLKPAIWEAQAARKHTLRRCTWLRDNGGIEATGWKPA